MPPAHPQRRKGAKFLDAKVLIGALSAALVIGLWNLFANNALAVQKAASTPLVEPLQQPAGAADGLPPLPTLVPLIDVGPVASASAAISPANPVVNQPSSLRAVAAPTQVIVQKVKPVIAGPVQQVSSGSGGGAPSPVTVTRSSHP